MNHRAHGKQLCVHGLRKVRRRVANRGAAFWACGKGAGKRVANGRCRGKRAAMIEWVHVNIMLLLPWGAVVSTLVVLRMHGWLGRSLRV